MWGNFGAGGDYVFHSRRNYDRPRFHVRDTNWSPEGAGNRGQQKGMTMKKKGKGGGKGGKC